MKHKTKSSRPRRTSVSGWNRKRRFLPLVFAISWILGAGSGMALWAQTTSGIISRPEIWSGVVELTGDVTVGAGGMLTILPGTRVQALPNQDDTGGGKDPELIELIVKGGRLLAEGSENNPILLTTAAEEPMPGQWHGIRLLFGEQGLSQFTALHLTVEYGVNGLATEGGGLYSINHVTSTDNEKDGFVFVTPGSFSHLEGNRNGGKGLMGEGIQEGDFRLADCQFNGNGLFGLMVGTHFVEVVLENVEVSGNSVGVYWTGLLTMRDSSMISNDFHGLWTENLAVNSQIATTLSLTNCFIIENQVDGIRFPAGTPYTISNSQITGNAGNGINKGIGTLENCVISQNGENGVLWEDTHLNDPAVLQTLRDCIVAGNGGHGVSDREQGSLRLERCRLAFNREDGLNTAAKVVEIVDSQVIGNQGAGISLDRTPTPHIEFSGEIRGSEIKWNSVGIEFVSVNTGASTISDTDLHSNVTRDVQIESETDVTADGNYWGATTTTELNEGAANLSRILDQQDDPSVGRLIIDDFVADPLFETQLSIVTQPTWHATTSGGGMSVLRAELNAGDFATYQWFLNDQPIEGAVLPELEVDRNDPAAAGFYTLVITDGEKSVSSDAVPVAPAYISMFAGLTLNGQPGDIFRVEYREDLGAEAPWHVLETHELTQETEIVFDRESSDHPYRFYRAIKE